MRFSDFLSASSKGELHLIMRLDLLSRRKGNVLCWWRDIFEGILPFLCCDTPPSGTTAGHQFFCECWNTWQPREAISVAAAHSSCAWGRRSHRYWFVSWQKLSWESLQAPLQKRGELWITGQAMHMDSQASSLWRAASPCSAAPRDMCLIHQGSHLSQRLKKRDVTKKLTVMT